MFGDGLTGGVEVVGDGTGCHGVDGQQGNDGPAGGIGDGLKYVSAGFHFMQLYDCKYTRSYLTAQNFWEIFLGELQSDQSAPQLRGNDAVLRRGWDCLRRSLGEGLKTSTLNRGGVMLPPFFFFFLLSAVRRPKHP